MKFGNPALVEHVNRCAVAGYTQEATAMLLSLSRNTVRRIAASSSLKFGNTSLPVEWGPRLRWVVAARKLRPNLWGRLQDFVRLRDLHPSWSLEVLEKTILGVAPYMMEEWQEAYEAAQDVRAQLFMLLDKITPKP